ncbi:uncharacterized protein [Drosophila takahashii]|uniref:uncharacterized protein n=1 Tax=Drosophila takahashii TaxID=29030 RepID=UPI001CF8D2E6|nr:uncharacterized protein LOC108068199 [Drosophila takahashii]
MPAYTCTQILDAYAKDLPSISTKFTLNAAHFRQRDLNLFVDSLETISRLEKERDERRQHRREQKLQQARMNELKDERCASPTPSADEAADEPLLYLEAKCIPYAVSEARAPCMPEYCTYDDEAYGSVSHSARSSVSYCSCVGISSQDSDSAESEVSGLHIGAFVRPRSVVITQSKHTSTRSRIINMVLKREYPKTPYTEHLEFCGPAESEATRDQNRRLTNSRKSSPEQTFLDKALRYLTL